MTSIKEHVKRALEAPVVQPSAGRRVISEASLPQESVRAVHSHFTPEALTHRYCTVCGVILPTVKEESTA